MADQTPTPTADQANVKLTADQPDPVAAESQGRGNRLNTRALLNETPTPKPGADGVVPNPPTGNYGQRTAYATAGTEVAPGDDLTRSVPRAQQDLTSLHSRPAFPDQLRPGLDAVNDQRHVSPVPSLPVTHMWTKADAAAYVERMSLLLSESMNAVRGCGVEVSNDTRVGRFINHLRTVIADAHDEMHGTEANSINRRSADGGLGA
jgi:hypothetical protein